MSTNKVAGLPTPALVVDGAALDHNIEVMAAALPGDRMRPHVKAHKRTSLARQQAAAGHRGFTCATVRECEGMAAAGLGADLNSLNLGAPSSLRTCSMTGVPGDLDDTELVDMSASYLASGLSAMSAESAFGAHVYR